MRSKPVEEPKFDLEELEEDRRRNEYDRRRMQETYARWLEEKGILTRSGSKRPRQRPRKA
jgi:hypothetical protein